MLMSYNCFTYSSNYKITIKWQKYGKLQFSNWTNFMINSFCFLEKIFCLCVFLIILLECWSIVIQWLLVVFDVQFFPRLVESFLVFLPFLGLSLQTTQSDWNSNAWLFFQAVNDLTSFVSINSMQMKEEKYFKIIIIILKCLVTDLSKQEPLKHATHTYF